MFKNILFQVFQNHLLRSIARCIKCVLSNILYNTRYISNIVRLIENLLSLPLKYVKIAIKHVGTFFSDKAYKIFINRLYINIYKMYY